MNKFFLAGVFASSLLLAGCHHPETELEAVERMQKDAEPLVRQNCSNDLIGITRVVKVDLDFYHGPKGINSWMTPEAWSATAIAEHINAVGGIERTNMYWRFLVYNGEKRKELLCITDTAKHAEEDERLFKERLSKIWDH